LHAHLRNKSHPALREHTLRYCTSQSRSGRLGRTNHLAKVTNTQRCAQMNVHTKEEPHGFINISI